MHTHAQGHILLQSSTAVTVGCGKVLTLIVLIILACMYNDNKWSLPE